MSKFLLELQTKIKSGDLVQISNATPVIQSMAWDTSNTFDINSTSSLSINGISVYNKAYELIPVSSLSVIGISITNKESNYISTGNLSLSGSAIVSTPKELNVLSTGYLSVASATVINKESNYVSSSNLNISGFAIVPFNFSSVSNLNIGGSSSYTVEHNYTTSGYLSLNATTIISSSNEYVSSSYLNIYGTSIYSKEYNIDSVSYLDITASSIINSEHNLNSYGLITVGGFALVPRDVISISNLYLDAQTSVNKESNIVSIGGNLYIDGNAIADSPAAHDIYSTSELNVSGLSVAEQYNNINSIGYITVSGGGLVTFISAQQEEHHYGGSVPDGHRFIYRPDIKQSVLDALEVGKVYEIVSNSYLSTGGYSIVSKSSDLIGVIDISINGSSEYEYIDTWKEARAEEELILMLL